VRRQASRSLLDAERISSGRIREALSAGDSGTATNAEPAYAITGVVQRGDQRGRELGFRPRTWNRDYQRPKYGIYAVRVTAR